MADSPDKKKLFFVKSPGYATVTAETFLKKRNFEVYAETILEKAINKIYEVQPDFIFFALDHLDPSIEELPKLAAQGCMAPAIPYITSSNRNATRKLNLYPQSVKIYPPISGPAIERLVLKTYKQAAEEEARNSKDPNKPSKTTIIENSDKSKRSSMTFIKSGHANKAAENSSDDIRDSERYQEQTAQHKAMRHKAIHIKNDFLKQPKNSNSPEIKMKELKKTVNSKVKEPMESLLNTLHESEYTGANSMLQAGSSATEDYYPSQENPSSTSTPAMISTTSENNSNKKNHLQSKHSAEDMINRPTRAYCMAIYSDSWCGYLIITTKADLDFSTVDMVFSEWIKLQFENMQEVDEYDYFELDNVNSEMISQLSQTADYFESIKVNEYDLNISFFPVDPNKMILELSDDQNLIKILTEDIPSDLKLDFSLHLHLPENKKYLLYTQANKALSTDQKERLLAKKIATLYTSLDFEKEYKKFLAEKNVKLLYESLSKKLKSV